MMARTSASGALMVMVSEPDTLMGLDDTRIRLHMLSENASRPRELPAAPSSLDGVASLLRHTPQCSAAPSARDAASAQPQPPQTGEAWIYVTGTVVLRRAPQPDATPVIMSRVTDGDSLAATNDGTVLASRAYVASWECITAAVKVSRAFSGPVVG